MKIGLFSKSSQTIGFKGLQFSGFDGVVLGMLAKIGLFTNLSQIIGPRGLNFAGIDGGHFIMKFGKDSFFPANSSQTIAPEGLKFSRSDGGHPGDVMRKFGEDRGKTLPVELFFTILWL